MKQFGVTSADHGAEKRRSVITYNLHRPKKAWPKITTYWPNSASKWIGTKVGNPGRRLELRPGPSKPGVWGALSGSPAAIRSNQPLTCRSYCRGREPTKEHCPYLYLLRLGDVRCDSSRLIAGLLIATPTQPNYQHDQAQQPPNSATEQSNLGRTTHISVAGSSQDADQLAQGLLIVGGR